MSRMLLISSDGHATARMKDYRPYLDRSLRDDFDDFVKLYDEVGGRNFDPPALARRIDQDAVDDWIRDVVEPGRLDGNWDPQRRLTELEHEGVSGEVLFPDFGLPWELYSPLHGTQLGHKGRTPEQIVAGTRAYNRWLADFCSCAPERFAGMAAITFDDVEGTLDEIRAAAASGLKGVVLPALELDRPVFSPDFEPIWSLLEELGLVVNVHVAISATTTSWRMSPQTPHPAVLTPIFHNRSKFFCRELFGHMVWGGVFEQHPDLKCVMTEVESGWIARELRQMDYTYQGSYLRSDLRDFIKSKPSEYFARQCYLGSSVFSRAEVEMREEIGIDKMMIGVDYPHHEGTWTGGTQDYLQATFGAAGVPVADATAMLGLNAASVFGFDVELLERVASRVGPEPDRVLVPPTVDKFPRGDVNKPM